MKYLPIHLDIRNKRVVVAGGGAVAERKCQTLLNAGARVRVIAPLIVDSLEKLRNEGLIEHLARKYRSGDLGSAVLAFAATNCRETNRALVDEAVQLGIPVNCLDAPGISTFVSPAVVVRGDLLFTVSTGGRSPALAAKIRGELEERFGDEYAEAVDILGAIREKLLTGKKNRQYNKGLLKLLVSHDLPKLLKNRSYDEIDHHLRRLFGPEFILQELGVGKRDQV
jgi:precorrin-2 dehydrogenase/sirohydrochlorin ferrochelatase